MIFPKYILFKRKRSINVPDRFPEMNCFDTSDFCVLRGKQNVYIRGEEVSFEITE